MVNGFLRKLKGDSKMQIIIVTLLIVNIVVVISAAVVVNNQIKESSKKTEKVLSDIRTTLVKNTHEIRLNRANIIEEVKTTKNMLLVSDGATRDCIRETLKEVINDDVPRTLFKFLYPPYIGLGR
jgi:hypothetical protein